MGLITMRFRSVQLPEELVFDILARVPIKELGRCKCVCKPWRSLIGSPQFRRIYRSRDRGLMLYWSETGHRTGEFRFHYSHPSRRLEDDEEEFKLLRELHVGHYSGHCRLVNGLICFREAESEGAHSIYSVCRGEKMMVPEPLPYSGNYLFTDSSYDSYHLGFDHVNRRYKLLRLISPDPNITLQAHIITLQPSGLQSQWRKLDAACFCNLPDPYLRLVYVGKTLTRLRTYSGDGVVCWMSFLVGYLGVIVFVVDEERFRWIEFPADMEYDWWMQQIVPRAQFREQRLALSLWVPIEHEGDGPDLECFILEDDVGERWSKHFVSFPREVGVTEITLVNSDSHCVVKIPEELRRSDSHGPCQHKNAQPGFCSRLSFLPNSYDHFYLSLDDLLSGQT